MAEIGPGEKKEGGGERESGGCSSGPNPVKRLSCFDALVSCYSQMVDLSPRNAVRFDYLEFATMPRGLLVRHRTFLWVNLE